MPQWPKDPDEDTRRDEQMRVPPNMMIPTHDNNDNEKEKNQTSNQGAITKCRYLEIGFSLCFYCISNNTHSHSVFLLLCFHGRRQLFCKEACQVKAQTAPN